MVDAPCKIVGTSADLQIKEMDRIDRKGLCFGGGDFFCNTMLDDGVKENHSRYCGYRDS